MAKLTGQTIADSYDQLLIVGDANGISSSLQAVESADDGGSSSALSISTVAISVTGNATITTADNTDTLALISTDTDANAGPNLNLYRNSGSPLDNDFLGNIKFNGRNDNSQDVQYAEIEVYATDVSDSSESGLFNLNLMTGGTNRTYMQLQSDEVVFNEDSANIDFRVESDGNQNMLLVDAGSNAVGVGTSDFNAMGSSSYAGLKVGGSVLQDSGGGNGSATFWGNNAYVGGSNNFYHDGNGKCSGIQMTSGDINFLTFDGGGGVEDAQWSPTARMVINDDGVIETSGDFKPGADVIMASGRGISFTADGNATGMTSELLDDYEEGIHTTAITGGTSGSFTLESDNQSLAYTKIGRMVTVQGKFQTSSGSGSGQLKISMPFTANNSLDDNADISVGAITMNRTGSTSPSTQMTAIIFANNAFVNIQLHNESNANETYLQADDVDGTFEGQICISYIV